MNYAEATCVLKVNIHCQACKKKILGVLHSVCGLYNVDIDCERGMIRVSGLFEPDMLTSALMKTGYHAELKWVNFHHPKFISYNSGYSAAEDYDPYSNGYKHGYNYGYRGIEEAYNYRPWNDYATMPAYGLDYPYHHNLNRRYAPDLAYHQMDPYHGYGLGATPY